MIDWSQMKFPQEVASWVQDQYIMEVNVDSLLKTLDKNVESEIKRSFMRQYSPLSTIHEEKKTIGILECLIEVFGSIWSLLSVSLIRCYWTCMQESGTLRFNTSHWQGECGGVNIFVVIAL